MTFSLDPGTVVAFLLVMTRLVTVLSVAPPLGGSVAPVRVRVAIAAGIALVVAPTQPSDLPLDAASLLLAVGYQVVVGALFGFVIQLLLTAPLIAGALADYLVGFSAAALFDPLTNASATPVARLNQLITTLVLFVLEGHLLMIRGVLRTYEVAPLSGIRIDAIPTVLSEGAGQMMLAAIEIALPLLVALLLAEVLLSLAAKAAPKLNVLVIGFALKSIVLLLVFSVTVPLVINAAASLLDRSLRWAVGIAGG